MNLYLGPRDLARVEPRRTERLPHFVTVASGKGGTGTSTVALLLALGARAEGLSDVLLIDADENLGSLQLLIGRAAAQPSTQLLPGLELLGWEPRPDQTSALRRTFFNRLVPRIRESGLAVTDVGSRLEAVRTAVLAGTGRLIVVAQPDEVSIASAYALIKVAHAWDARLPIDVVINRHGDRGAQASTLLGMGTERFLGRSVGALASLPQAEALGASELAELLLEARLPLPGLAGEAGHALAEPIVRGLTADLAAAGSSTTPY